MARIDGERDVSAEARLARRRAARDLSPDARRAKVEGGRAQDDAVLQPWQFFLLGGMLAATATVVVATGQSPANIIILSLTVVAVSFVGLGAYRTFAPLVSADVEAPTLVGGRTRIALEREKALVLRSLKELEFDFAMGKMSQADFDEMSGRLRRRAVGLMRQLDSGGGYREQIEREVERRLAAHSEGEGFGARQEATADAVAVGHRLAAPAEAVAVETRQEAPAEVVALRTCECGTTNDPDARFCKSCGSRL